MLRLAVLSLLAASSSAFHAKISAKTKAGQRLLKKAKHVSGRKLEDNNMENVIASLHLIYSGCYNAFHLAEDGGGEGSGIENSGVITFELAESCSGSGHVGKYATNMLEFLDAYTESMMEEQEWRCEFYRENFCYCDNADDEETCENNCFAQGEYEGNSMAVCQQWDGEEEFEIQRYLECGEIEAQNNNNQNNYNNNQNGNNGNNGNGNGNNGNGNGNMQNGYSVYPQWDGEYRVGPYCDADGVSIYLGVFYDEECTIPGPMDAYSYVNYGASLPYSSESIIPVDSCVSCVDQQAQYENNQNGNNNYNQNQNNYNNNQQWNNMEPREFCMQAYEDSAKCEVESSYVWYATATGCDFINNYLPNLASASAFSFGSSSGNGAAVLFAWVFAVTTLLFGAYAYFLYRKIKRGSAALSSQDGGTLA